MTRGIRALSLMLTATFAACGTSHDDSEKSGAGINRTTENLSEVFRKQLGPTGTLLGISRAALDRDLLFTASLIQQGSVPSFSGLQSRIVRFTLKDRTLQLVDVTEPASSYGEKTKLLASFAVADQNDNDLFFDFTEGTNTLFANGEWYAPDSQGFRYDPNQDATVLRAARGYIDEATVVGAGILYIRQISQLAIDNLLGSSAPTVEIRYTLRPYAPNESFVPRPVPLNMDRMGFFAANPRFRGDQLVDDVFIARFSTQAPIRFAISANTPPEYREAVRDGVRYWNLAFGGELVTVEEAPEGISAPDPRYNMIQWVPYDTAGGAYADAQLDPRTGEVLHANVFFTSAFAISGKGAVRQRLGATQAARDGLPGARLGAPSLIVSAGWDMATRCRMDANEALENSLVTLLDEVPTDALMLRASQDYVREVVAHEVGHTLGLRHNFAGSYGATYDPRDLPELFTRYVRGEEPGNELLGSSSVMEYQAFFDAAVSGSRMRRGLGASPYDVAAMQVLYRNADIDRTALPLFCTDSHVGLYLDCARFDVGGSPIRAAMTQEQTTIEGLAIRLAERFASRRVAFPNAPVDTVALDPVGAAAELFANRRSVLRLLSKDARLLEVERSFPRVDSSNEALVKNALDTHLSSEIQARGGLAQILAPADLSVAARLPEAFSKYIRRDSFRNGPGWNGRMVHFDESELAMMEQLVATFASRLSEELVKAELNALSEPVVFARGPRGDLIVPVLSQRTEETLVSVEGYDEVDVTVMVSRIDPPVDTGGNGTPTPMSAMEPSALTSEPEGDGTMAPMPSDAMSTSTAAATREDAQRPSVVRVRLPRFRQPIEARVTAAGLLERKRGESRTWGMAARAALRERLKALYETDTGIELLKLDPEQQTRDIADWILENRQVRDALN